jgi:uncharacterized protein (DUF111 family)
VTDGLLILAQVDDAPGELVAEAVDELFKAGAGNVQVLTSLTKKGRPGYVLLVDAGNAREEDIALVLAAELGTSGYQVLAASHRHCDLELEHLPVVVRYAHDDLAFDVRLKRISRNGQLLRVKADHDDLARIHDALHARGRMLPLAVLRARVEEQAWTGADGGTLTLEL